MTQWTLTNKEITQLFKHVFEDKIFDVYETNQYQVTHFFFHIFFFFRKALISVAYIKL